MLAAALADPDDAARFAAVQAWEQLYRGMPQGNKALVHLVRDPDAGIRAFAVKALLASAARQPDPEVTNAFQALLTDPDGVLRVQAALGLSYRPAPPKSEPTFQADPATLSLLIGILANQTDNPDAEAHVWPRRSLEPLLAQG